MHGQEHSIFREKKKIINIILLKLYQYYKCRMGLTHHRNNLVDMNRYCLKYFLLGLRFDTVYNNWKNFNTENKAIHILN